MLKGYSYNLIYGISYLKISSINEGKLVLQLKYLSNIDINRYR